MKKIALILILLSVITSCKNNNSNTKEKLAENIFESLQNNDFEQFKNSIPSIELFKLQQKITEDEYDNLVTDFFIKCKKRFSSKNIDITEYEIFKVNEPYEKGEWKGFEQINFYVIIKNSKNNFLKLDFKDCPKTDDGFKLGEAITIIK